ncbi:MAG: hypothetical protein GEU74_08975 [Nitriliruptorales bacterium]|nr:hypothetical protein [Nitriliruptorales bacterium]
MSLPAVLFLDEPTTGLDPRSRKLLWVTIRDLVSDGTTLLLTTQYLEEADMLANRIMVIDHGALIAEGTSDQLKARVGGDRIDVHVADRDQARHAAEALSFLGDPLLEEDEARVSVPVTSGSGVLPEVVRRLDDVGVTIEDLALRHHTNYNTTAEAQAGRSGARGGRPLPSRTPRPCTEESASHGGTGNGPADPRTCRTAIGDRIRAGWCG